MEALTAAQAHVLANLAPLAPRAFPLREARGLVLAESVVANEPVPPFSNTAMDGYAVRAADTHGAPVRLRVVGDLPAGHAPTVAVGPGEALRIMTGAPMPDGADAIVMVELTTPDGDEVVIGETVPVGNHVRRAGGDVEPGGKVFDAGTVLTPAHIGVLASLDIAEVRCYPRPKVGVLSTGDELVERGALQVGQIRDSNRPMMLAVVEEAGCTPVDYGIVRDDEELIVATIERAANECDAVLTSGAVSVGDYDFVKVALQRLGEGAADGEYKWMQVAIKPAKPLAFARIGATPIFGLPGNPVSSRVSFELFARPALRKLMGHAALFRDDVVAVARSAMKRRPDGKLHLDRVRVTVEDGQYVCTRAGEQASNVLSGMAAANGLALLEDGEGVEAGAPIRVLLLD